MGKPQFSVGNTSAIFSKRIFYLNNRLMIPKLTTDSLRVKDNIVVNGNASVGSGSAAGILHSTGNNDLTLRTGNSITGNITIADGANGDISITPNGTGSVLSKAIKHTAIVDLALPIAGAGATLEATFSQPANTIITAISIFCETSPVVASGDIGFKVGNATGGAQLVAAATDGILDGGTTIVVGHVRPLTLVAVAAKTATAAVDLHYTSSARNVFLQVSHTTASTTIGAFKFIIEYDQIA